MLNDFYRLKFLKAKVPKQNVQQDIANLFNNETYSDLKIESEGKMIFVNKAILAIRN